MICLSQQAEKLTAAVKKRHSLMNDLGKNVRHHAAFGTIDPQKTDQTLAANLYRSEGAPCGSGNCYNNPEQRSY